jgi:hypothetical protein
MINYSLLFLIIIFSSFNALSRDYLDIPNGDYHGKLSIGGDVYCISTIYKIKVKDKNITIYSDDILGPRRYKFILNEDKFENRFFIINNISAPYEFNYRKEKKSIDMKIFHNCVGSAIFRAESEPVLFNIDKHKNETEEKDDNTAIENIISTSTKLCEEMGLKNEDKLMNKCVLTLIKKHKIFKN